MARVLHPYQLLKKDLKYTWTSAAQKAFDSVKEMIISNTVLTHYNPKLPVKLAFDSSAYGLGAVISHVMENREERRIAFASRTLNAAEKNCHKSEGSISCRMGSKEISLLSVWKEFYACHGSSAIAVNHQSKERDTCYNCFICVYPTGTRLWYRIQKLEIARKLRWTIATSVFSQWGTAG